MMFGMKVKGVAFREDLHTTPVTSVTIEELWGRRKSFQLIDVRTPDEFAAGTIPGAINFPLLSQTQHHQIGTLYRAFGQERAVAAGYDQLRHRLAGNTGISTSDSRLTSPSDFLRTRRDAFSYYRQYFCHASI